MDDLFALGSLLAAALWIAAVAVRRYGRAPHGLAHAANYILSLRSYFVALFVVTVFRVFLYEMFWIPSASMQPTLRKGEFVVVDKSEYGVRIPLLDMRVGRGTEPERGDVAVFRFPLRDDIFYIKRIVAVPGDEFIVNGNQLVFDNGATAPATYQGAASGPYIYHESAGGLVNGLLNMVGAGEDEEEVASALLWEELPDGWHPLLLSDVYWAPAAQYRGPECRASYGGARLRCTVPPDSYFVMGDNRHRSNDSRFWGFVPRSKLVGPAFAVAFSLDQLGRSFSGLGLTAEAAPLDGFAPDPQRPDPYAPIEERDEE